MSHLKGITNIDTRDDSLTAGQILAVVAGIFQALAGSVTGKEADSGG